MHEESKLLLSVYVDDLKMVGLKQNIAPMWAKIRKLVNLDPETELVDHVYLGCTQRAATPRKESIKDKQRLFAQLMAKERSDSNAGGDDGSSNNEDKVTSANSLPEKGSKDQYSFVHPSLLTPSLTEKS